MAFPGLPLSRAGAERLPEARRKHASHFGPLVFVPRRLTENLPVAGLVRHNIVSAVLVRQISQVREAARRNSAAAGGGRHRALHHALPDRRGSVHCVAPKALRAKQLCRPDAPGAGPCSVFSSLIHLGSFHAYSRQSRISQASSGLDI